LGIETILGKAGNKYLIRWRTSAKSEKISISEGTIESTKNCLSKLSLKLHAKAIAIATAIGAFTRTAQQKVQ
jgi:hypothetical protein